MPYYEVKLSVYIEAENKIDAIEKIMDLYVPDLEIDSVEEK